MTANPKSADIDYFACLGAFIHQFAQVESLLFTQLVLESKIPANVARAIFSDAKNDRARDLIKRIRASRGLPESPLLKRAFDQLSEINRLRNDLVHFGTVPRNGIEWVSNKSWIHIPTKLREYPVTARLLLDALHDLETIKALFVTHMTANTQAQDIIAERFGCAAQSPWQYKPPPQGSSDRKS